MISSLFSLHSYSISPLKKIYEHSQNQEVIIVHFPKELIQEIFKRSPFANFCSYILVNKQWSKLLVDIGCRNIKLEGIRRSGIFNKEGQLNGQGRIIYPNGKKEEGEFQNGQLHGFAEITYPHKTVFQGYFKKGIVSIGEKIYSNGIRAKGNFRNNLDLNIGVQFRHPDGTNAQNDNIFLHGKGEITYLNGLVARGNYHYNFLNGKGEIKYPDRTREKGEYENGVLSGEKIVIYTNGEVKKRFVKRSLEI